MLTDEFEEYRDDNPQAWVWPATFSVTFRKSAKADGTDLTKLEEFVENGKKEFAIPTKEEITFAYLAEQKSDPIIPRHETVDWGFKISMMTNLYDHIELTAGRFPEDRVLDDNVIEVIVSEGCVKSLNLLLDEEFLFRNLYTLDGETPYRLRIVGFFRPTNTNETYWATNPGTLSKNGFISPELFRKLFLDDPEAEKYYAFTISYISVWDYTKIAPSDVKRLTNLTSSISSGKGYGKFVDTNNYVPILEKYSAKAKKVEASLLILQIPALLLLCAFLYMISGQMIEMEQSEISLMKSRGAKRWQILTLYTLQSLFIGFISLLAGLPFGRLICSVLGASSDFLEFSANRKLRIVYSPDILTYAAGALLVGVLMTVIPVVRYSKLSIVNVKQNKHKKKKSFWRAAFLDVIFLGVSGYGYYSFMRTENNIIESILTGESLDPLIYFSSSLFILGAALLFMRLQPLLVNLIYRLRKKHLKPAAYASFLESIRSGRKQEFIMIFLMLTVALGIYNATVARTIVSNAEANASYVNGADVVLKEKWADNSAIVAMDPSVEFEYSEPDTDRWTLVKDVESIAKVYNKQYTIKASSKTINANLMGIYPSEFAKVTKMDDDLLVYDYYDYLNVLASTKNGFIVSENFMTKLDLSIGSSLTFVDEHGGDLTGRIYGFFSYWPGYEPCSYSLNSDGTLRTQDNYLVVGNLSYLQEEWDVYPYEVWMKTDGKTEGIYEFIEESRTLKLTKFNDLSEIREDIRTDTMFQGTNGILTMSFIIVLVLCAVGYLIYWIMSIRSRELLFGVLRAMGMKKTEITQMLMLEQILSGFYSIIAGSIIGFVASYMFVPLVQGAYAASNQVLPLVLTVSLADMIKLFATILMVVVVCIVVIVKIVSGMNISGALKLGED